uniref:Uncharacterized protein n=1 Tax=Ditylum brightwellii TaxID=49249 RepID=A0A7S4W6V0_9STRA
MDMTINTNNSKPNHRFHQSPLRKRYELLLNVPLLIFSMTLICSSSFPSSAMASSTAFLHTIFPKDHKQHLDYKDNCMMHPLLRKRKNYLFGKRLTSIKSSSSSSQQKYKRERAKINGRIPILSRTVPLGVFNEEEEELKTIVWEMEDPSDLIEAWWSTPQSLGTSAGFGCGISPSSGPNLSREKIGDPFGVVMWPGSILASQQLWKNRELVKDKVVLVLGAGVGVEAQAAAMAGAKKVIATDINKLTLRLLKFGAEKMGLDGIIEGTVFDLFSSDPLPKCDIVVAADVLYNEYLATQIGLRCHEILSLKNPPSLVVTDSQRFHGTDFLQALNERLRSKDGKVKPLEWKECTLEQVTSSGVLVKEDQTYDVKTRMVSIGWGDSSNDD